MATDVDRLRRLLEEEEPDPQDVSRPRVLSQPPGRSPRLVDSAPTALQRAVPPSRQELIDSASESIRKRNETRQTLVDRAGRRITRRREDRELAVQSAGASKARSLVGAFTSGFGPMVAGVPEALEELLTVPFEALGGNIETPPEDRPGRRLGESIRRGFRGPINPEYQDDFSIALAGGAGSLVGFAAGVFLGRGAGLFRGAQLASKAGLTGSAALKVSQATGKKYGLIATATLGMAAQGAEGIRDAERNNATAKAKFGVFVGNLGLGATEALPFAAVLNRLDKGTGGMVTRWITNNTKRVLAAGGSGALEEGIQEFIQGAGSNAIAKALFDADREILDAGVAEGTAVGGILGFTMSALFTALGGRAARRLNTPGGLETPPPDGPAAQAEAAASGKPPLAPPPPAAPARPEEEAVSAETIFGAEQQEAAEAAEAAATDQAAAEEEAAAIIEPGPAAVLQQRKTDLEADYLRVKGSNDPTARVAIQAELDRVNAEIEGSGEPGPRSLKDRKILARTPLTSDTADIVLRKIGGLDTAGDGNEADYSGLLKPSPLAGRKNLYGLTVSDLERPGAGKSIDHFTRILLELGFIREGLETDLNNQTTAILDRIVAGELVRNPLSPTGEAELAAEAKQHQQDLEDQAAAAGETGEAKSIQQLMETLAALDESEAERISTLDLSDPQLAAVLQDSITRLTPTAPVQGDLLDVEPTPETEPGIEPAGLAQTEREPISTEPAAEPATGAAVEPAAQPTAEPGTGEPGQAGAVAPTQDEIKFALGDLADDLDALDRDEIPTRFGSNFEAATDDQIPALIEQAKATIQGEIAQLQSQLSVEPAIGDESRRMRPRNQLWNEAAEQMDPENAVAVDDAQVGDTVLEQTTRYEEIDPFSDYGVVIAVDDRTGGVLVESPQDTYSLRQKKRETRDPNAGVNWITLHKGQPTAWGLAGANPAINDASSVTREQVLEEWRRNQDEFADTLQRDEADAQAIRDTQEKGPFEVIEQAELRLEEGANAANTDSLIESILQIEPPNYDYFSDDEAAHQAVVDAFLVEVAAKSGWRVVGRSENKMKYGILVGEAQVELYKSGKGMGWNLQLRPPEKDWKKATKVLIQAAQEAAGATIEPQEDRGGIQEPIHRPDAGTGTQDVQRTPPVGQTRPAPTGQVSGGAPTTAQPDGRGAEVPERGDVQEPEQTAVVGGDSQVATDRVPTGRPPTQGSIRQDADAVTGTNYQIAPGALRESRGTIAKARHNIDAIRLMREISAEGRTATHAEQEILAQYVGWGALKEVFPDRKGQMGVGGFRDVGKLLRDLLNDTDYKIARRSLQYAHYTSETVTRAMWSMAERLGFAGGKVFEPGMGVGNFAGFMPAELARSVDYHGLELDPTTTDIARLLYPQWGVRQDDFTRAPLPLNTYDLVIGNPPFADVTVRSDAKYPQKFLLHDYFFAKSLDAVRPGGILMFISSAGTMNKLNSKARDYLADQADLVAAIRLPGSAFEQSAGTKVTTDIIILRKRLPDEPEGDRLWTQTETVELPNRFGNLIEGAVNSYFVKHPEMVLGEEGFFDPLFEGRYAVRVPPGETQFNLEAQLGGAIERLPQDVMTPWQGPTEKAEIDFTSTERKEDSFYLKDGRLFQQQRGVGVPVPKRSPGVKGGVIKSDISRIKKLIPIRDALRSVYEADLDEDTENADKARVRLNKSYDSFVSEFGPINKAVFTYHRPTIVQQEGARQQAREAYRLESRIFREGTFDGTRYQRRTGANLTKVARAREDARVAAGQSFDEGSFDPADMPLIKRDKRPNIKAFMLDPESYRLRAIEKYDDDTLTAEKGAVFTQNVITREKEPEINSLGDAVLFVLNREGKFNLDSVAEAAGVGRKNAIQELGERIFQDPASGNAWVLREEYLSGNVKQKLSIAREAAQADPELQRNVDELVNVQPFPLSPAEIKAHLGTPWIPPKLIEEFATRHLGLVRLKAGYHPKAGWNISGDTSSAASTVTWGTPDVAAPEIINLAINRQQPKVTRVSYVDGQRVTTVDIEATQAAVDKVADVKQAFKDWIWADEKRANTLADFYNDNFNNIVIREYNGDYLTTPGASATWEWRAHQTRVIARIVQSGNTYMAHAVGSGKTAAMIGAGMEMRRLGLVRKPMYVVPMSMLPQFTREFYELYPTARIMVADEQRFHTSRRKQFIANAAQEDLDAIIITHPSFGKIPMSGDFMGEWIQDQIEELRDILAEAGDLDRISRRRIEVQVERLEQKLSAARATDQVFTFEEMGVDFLFVDEAHKFRKLDIATRMGGVKGITPEGSDRARDLFIKTRYLETINPKRNVVFASGTPITNTMAELHTLSKFMDMRSLEERQISHFDAWAGAFGDTKTDTEQDPAGGYKQVTRFAQFVNVLELSNIVRQTMDVVSSRELDQYVVRPAIKGGQRKLHLATRGPALIQYQKQLERRMIAIQKRSGRPQRGDDILLSVISDGRKAAIDMRLVNPTLREDPDSKLNALVDNVFDIWENSKNQAFHETTKKGYKKKAAFRGPATQLVFANLGLNPKAGNPFTVTGYIRAELVKRGVPRDEIAFFADAKTNLAKQRLFNDVNEGKIRVLIGSTEKMGVGINVQKRALSVHNLDALWFPADDEQRIGRIFRQGNMNPEIQIHDYSTKGTYDSTMWGLMERKQRFIEAFFQGDPSVRDIIDLGEASQFEQAKAMTTADPRMIELTELKQELEKQKRRRVSHFQSQASIRQKILQKQDDIRRGKEQIAGFNADIARRVDITGDNFTATIDNKKFTGRKEFGEALLNKFEMLKLSGGTRNILGRKVAEIAGFDVVADIYTQRDDGTLYLEMSRGYRGRLSENSPRGVVQSIETTLQGFEYWRDQNVDHIPVLEASIAEFSEKMGEEFTGDAEIARLQKEVDTLEKLLLNKEGLPTSGEPAEDVFAKFPPPVGPPAIEGQAIDPAELELWLDDGGPLIDSEEINEPNPVLREASAPYNERPDSNADTRAMAKDLLKITRAAAEAPAQRRPIIKTLATAINVAMIKDQTAKLLGQKIKTGEDLATLAQVYRDPRWETLRYYGTDENGVIVYQTAISARLPGSVGAFAIGQTAKDLARDLKNAGVKHLWMQHNHPSGDSTASQADLDTTQFITDNLDKLLIGSNSVTVDHIVIDSNNYTHITSIPQLTGKALITTNNKIKRNFGRDFLLQPAMPHPLLHKQAANAEQLSDIAAALHHGEGWLTLVGTTTDGTVRALGEFHESLLENRGMLRKHLRAFARQHGAHDLYIVGVNPDSMFDGHLFWKRASQWSNELITRGFVRDVVDSNGISLTRKDPWVRPDENIEFGVRAADKSVRLREEGNYESTATDAQIKIVEQVRKGQPLDRLMRFMFTAPFKMFGLDVLDERGDLKAGVFAMDKIKTALTEAKFSDDSPFRWMNPYMEHARAGLIDRYGVDPELIQRGFEMTADQRALQLQGAEYVQRLMESGMTTLQEAVVVHKMLTGEDLDGNEALITKAEWDGLTDEIRQAVDTLGLEAVNLDLISRESYERNHGTYLHRVYITHEKGKDQTLSRFVGRLMAGKKHGIHGQAMKGRGIFHEVTQEQLLRDISKPDAEEFFGIKKRKSGKPDESLLTKQFRILDLFDEGKGVGTQTLPGVEDAPTPHKLKRRIFIPADAPIPDRLGNYEDRGVFEVRRIEGKKLVLWRNFTKPERVQMGEILDARYTIAKTFAIFAQDISSARFYRDIAQNEEWTWKDGETPPEELIARDESALRHYIGYEWVKVPIKVIPKTGGKTKWGALSGRYVRAEVWKDLSELDAMNQKSAWSWLLRQWKLNKTSRNPVVHANNVMSNVWLMDLIDIRARDLYRGVKEYRARGELYELARVHGGFGSDFISQEIQENILDPVLKDMDKEAAQGLYEEGSFLNKLRFIDRYSSMASEGIQRLGKKIKQLDKAGRDWYIAEDEIFRMAIFIRKLEQGYTPAEAAQMARDQMLNYDIRAPWVNTARRSVLPFIAYTYRAVPLIIDAMARRPWKMAKYALIAELANAFAYAVTDGDEEWERGSFRPEVRGNVWMGMAPRMMRMPVNDKHGNPIFLDIRRWIPAGDVFDIAPNNPLPIPSWMQFGGPIMIAGEMFLNRSAFTGQDIVNPLIDTLGDKTKKYGQFLYRSLAPSAPWIYDSWYWNKISRAVGGGRDALGRQFSVPEAVLSSIGIKAKGHDVGLNFEYRQREFDRTERALKYSFSLNDRDRQRGLISPKEYKQQRNDLLDKMRKLNENRRKTFAPLLNRR